MRQSPLVVRALAIGALIALPYEELRAQVGLQARNGNLWGAVVELSASGPVSLRWKWDGVGTPSKVVWQLATSTTSTRDNPIALEGALGVPAATGVYNPFTVTPPSSLRLPLYVRVRVDNAGKAAYSRWITIRPATSTTAASGTTAGTSGTDQLIPIKVYLTGIEAIRTALNTYENAPLTANGQPVKTDMVYPIAVTIELNWGDIAKSQVVVASSPVVGLTAGQTLGLKLPVWGPYNGPLAMKEQGQDAIMMLALMHRYQSPAISTLESAILSDIRAGLRAVAPTASTQAKDKIRSELLAAFRRALQEATEGDRPDRPVEMGEQGWAELVGGSLSTIGPEILSARAGQSATHFVTFGSDGNRGGHFRLRLLFHK